MTLTCPQCYAESSIEAAIESEAGRDYARLLLSQPPAIQRGLSAYVWMFRSAKRNLSYERRLKLAGEVLALGADPRALAAALSETVEALRAKRDQGDVRPLTGHNYLRRVLESVPMLPSEIGTTLPSLPARRPSRTALADQVLATWAGDDELRCQIAYGLQALLALPLALKPEADAIDRTATLWERELLRANLVPSEEDTDRVRRAFSGLLSAVKDKFPEPKTIFEYLPKRLHQESLEAPAPIDNPEAAKAFFRDLGERKGLPKAEKQDPEARRRVLQEQARHLRGDA